MLTWEDVAAFALALPGASETTSYGNRAWAVGTQRFAWARPFSKADRKRAGDDPLPLGDILAVVVDDLGEKEAVLAAHPDAVFTIEHFDGYPAVLIRLNVVSRSVLCELVQDAFLAVAPPDLIDRFWT